MDLFHTTPDPTLNLLPKDGKAFYYGSILDQDQADYYLHELMTNIEWRHDQLKMFGRTITTKRKVAWYGDSPFEYTYSHSSKQALPWTRELLELKTLLEKTSGECYNSCLLNLYHDGSEGMGWHSDDEKELKKNGAIASLSLGADRKFIFRHKKTKEKVDLFLHDGSLLVMKGTTQTHWQHRLPPTRRVLEPRINLTFRTIDTVQGASPAKSPVN
ncbi:alpha-ketoglutarate-dependent dioxygenase AlkB [Membranicola marinus]|uniref:Alpha-ketoglutarate-dependent dioxygenase AlkB n=1 Tax=Membranihabitans marinus TaxID=1227546 RepID=A0A953HUT1_9BACT|nr:alpha-ketoglutarate-dependent dioxygenase AlkB [Membranihabitans marinus]MBY5958596.1 alpha-ketoglutarate-dependent dioxygenase AlkB [Membranihabitans marinus]